MPHYDENGKVYSPAKWKTEFDKKLGAWTARICDELAPGWIDSLDETDRGLIRDIVAAVYDECDGGPMPDFTQES